ncbi:MAG: hypothetical protein HPY55_12730 [Firmicutes bacterium]|nr:hypothetical protein [Bacillota bacterium]
MFARTAFSGMGLLFGLVYIALIVYFFVLVSRATTALERIASALESKDQPTEHKT